MKVIVATDGTLDPNKVTKLAGGLAGQDGEVLVLSIIEVPRQLLEAIRVAGAQESGAGPASAEYAGQAADPKPRPGWVGDDAIIARYVEDQRIERTTAMADALRESGVANVRTMCHDSENVVKEILAVAETEGTDVICIGTLGLGRFEGLLGSISSKLARQAPIPVLLVR